MIKVESDGAFVQLIIDRPEKANSLTKQMLEDLADAVSSSAQDKSVLVLTGTGNVFSAGADLEAAKAGLATDGVWERLSGAIASFPGLTISALNGTVAGGAMGMVLATDLRICVPTAKFFYPVMKLGFLPQPSDPIRMERLIGAARSKLIFMAGQKISAPEALSFGLVDRIVEPDDLFATVKELSDAVLNAHPKHAKAIKAMFGAVS